MARGGNRGFDGAVPLTSTEISYTRGLQKMRSRPPWYYRALRIFRRIAVAFAVLSVIIIAVAMVQNVNLRDELRAQLDDTYNPSYKVRHADLGKSVLESWFSGGTQVISTSESIEWPESPYSQYPSPGNVPASSSNPQDAEAPEPSDAGGEGEGTAYSTTLRSVSFVEGGEVSLSEDPMTIGDVTYEDPTREELTYYAVLNNQPVHITVVLLVQGGVPDGYGPDPVLIAPPTISGVPSTKDDIKVDTSPPGISTNGGNLPESATSLANSWVAAYAENDTEALKQIARDPDASRQYPGLGGWTTDPEAEVSTNWWYTVPGTDGDDGSADIIAEITFDMYQVVPLEAESGDATDSPDLQNPEGYMPFKTTQTMTVMIQDAESGSPSISSWGPPGSAESLEPYSAATSAAQEEDE